MSATRHKGAILAAGILAAALSAPMRGAAADCPPPGFLEDWPAHEVLPGSYSFSFRENLYLWATERRRSRRTLDIPEREREFSFWIDEGELVGTVHGDSRDLHFVMYSAPLPAESFRSFELAGEMEFAPDDPAAEAALLVGCPFERLPRLIGHIETDADAGTQRTIRLIHMGEIGLIGTLETRMDATARTEMLHWDTFTLTPR